MGASISTFVLECLSTQSSDEGIYEASYKADSGKPVVHEEDHYDLINENEMYSTVFAESDDESKSPHVTSPLLKPHKHEKKSKSKIKRKSMINLDISMEEARHRCLEYSEMVNIFKPLIVQNLLVQDILPSLPFLENLDDIYGQVRNHSPESAVECLLKELERSEELGKWQKFIDALSANGYTYIVDNIRGYRFINQEYQKEYIKKLTPKIGKMIVASQLLPHLLAKYLISDSDNENIQRVDANQGNYAAAVLLLDRIHRMHRNWYIVFIETLLDASMDDVAADLQIPKLLESKRTKETADCILRSKLDKNQNKNSIDEIYHGSKYENDKNRTFCSKRNKRSIVRWLPLPSLRSREHKRELPPLPSTTDNANMPQEMKSVISYGNSIPEEEARNKCFEISEMVKIFKPLIVQNLLVEDILPSLPFLDNHDDIYAEMKNRSPKFAVVSLLDELERCEELGKWQKFIDALSANGYTYIVDNIRGYKFINHEYQREYIKKLTPKIRKMIVTRELLPHLLAKDVISDSDNENIQREDANHGNIAAADKLLDRIHRKHGNWYLLFIEALIEANMEDVAVDLRIPELLKTRRTKVTHVYTNPSITEVLSQIGMEEYISAFERNGICIEQIEIMTEEDFRKLGVEKMGTRLKIKQACRNFVKGTVTANRSEVVRELTEPKTKTVITTAEKRNKTECENHASKGGGQKDEKPIDPEPSRFYRTQSLPSFHWIDSLTENKKKASFHPRHNRSGRPSLRRRNETGHLSKSRSPDRNLHDLLKELSINADGNDDLRPTIINVTRANPLDGTRRAIHRSSFNPKSKLSVRFADDFGSSEGAVDAGGSTRELLRLLLKQISDLPVFGSHGNSGNTIVLDASALKDGIYKDVGVILALSLVHGRFPKMFNKTTYMLLTRDEVKPALTDICDYEIRAMIEKLYGANSLDELQETMDANTMLFQLAGCYRPICSFSVHARDKLADDIVQFLVVTRNLPAIHQLREGLNCLELLDMMQNNVRQFEEVFCVGEKTKLSAEDVESIFKKVMYSKEGSNRKREEERIVGYWRDYIIDLQETNDGVTLEDLLIFATATDQVPYFGFNPDPSIEFIHGSKGERILAQANTCAMVLRLPVVNSYDTFKKDMDFSILNSPGFGQA